MVAKLPADEAPERLIRVWVLSPGGKILAWGSLLGIVFFMAFKKGRLAFVFAALILPLVAAQDSYAKKTTTSKKPKVAYAASKHYFVPPPPPYVPNLLPSAYGQYYMGTTASKTQGNTVESMYGKYIYTRAGYKAPQAVQQNKYVTVWCKI